MWLRTRGEKTPRTRTASAARGRPVDDLTLPAATPAARFRGLEKRFSRPALNRSRIGPAKEDLPADRQLTGSAIRSGTSRMVLTFSVTSLPTIPLPRVSARSSTPSLVVEDDRRRRRSSPRPRSASSGRRVARLLRPRPRSPPGCTPCRGSGPGWGAPSRGRRCAGRSRSAGWANRARRMGEFLLQLEQLVEQPVVLRVGYDRPVFDVVELLVPEQLPAEILHPPLWSMAPLSKIRGAE